MAQLVLQLALITMAAWVGGLLARKIGLPAALGQLIAGIIIGPFALGSIGFPIFPQGIFPVAPGAIPVSPILYSFSTMASIILLFVSGLETDLTLFKRYAAKGAVVGIGGVVVSLTFGSLLTMLFKGVSPFSPEALFMGALCVASSVGIAATVLSSHRKIDSPEGTTILSAAVVDDILGIIILAVVVGISSRLMEDGGNVSLNAGELLTEVGFIVLKAFGIWLVATLLGLRFARSIGKGLKKMVKDHNQLAILAFGLALFMAGFMEEAGLSLVIGAYIVGLSLSNTDLAYLIQSRLGILKDFLVPIFFAISGMLLNLQFLMRWEVISFGIIFALAAVLAKLIGSGLPSLFLGFNTLGAARIGFGMVPRAEVTLVIAGIGVSSGVLSTELFGVALTMMIVSIIIAPIILNLLLQNPGIGVRNKNLYVEKTETMVNFQNRDFADLLITRFLGEMGKEGFFVNAMEHEETMYQMRKDDIFITLSLDDDGVAHFFSDPDHVGLFQTALYESLVSVGDATSDLKDRFNPEEMASRLGEPVPSNGPTKKAAFDLSPYLTSANFMFRLESTSKIEVITELIDMLDRQKVLKDRIQVLQAVLDRENSMTTGMQNGIAIPHAKTDGTSKTQVVLGLAPKGIDFQSMDGQPSTIFVLILSPTQGETHHLQILAAVSGVLKSEENRSALLSAKTANEALAIFGIKK